MICFPFDSVITGYDESDNPIYDRAADSQLLADWMRQYFSDGVFGDEDAGVYGFGVSASGSGLTVNVAAGACNIRGRFAKEESVTALTLNAASATYDRIDAIVLRLNLETAVRAISLEILTGTPAANPAAPSLQRDTTIWDLKIAEVRVVKNAETIAQANIKDTRLDTSVCGIVTVPMKTFDTSELFNQIEAALLALETNNQAQFDAWFQTIQDILDEDVAGHLQNEIEDIRSLRIDFSGLNLTLNSGTGQYEAVFVNTDLPVAGTAITEDMVAQIFLTEETMQNFQAAYSLETDTGSVTISSSRALRAAISGFILLTPTNVVFEPEPDQEP